VGDGWPDAADGAARALPEAVRPQSRAGRLAAALGASVALVFLLGALLVLVADLLGIGSWQQLLESLKRPQLSGIGMLTVEEMGVPVPVPGDLIIMFLAHSVGLHLVQLGTTWFGLVVGVTAGASVLFLVARRWGNRLAHGHLGAALHLTPERLERTEAWFQRWGFWTIVFGRLIPGGRVPVTASSGIFGVRYPVFLGGLVISSVIWITGFMIVGLILGPKAEELVGAHRTISYVVMALGGAFALAYIAFRLITHKRR
jgi:membrane-associated protein